MAILSSPLGYISSTPVVTRVLAASTLFTSTLYLFLRWNGEKANSLPYLTLVPGSSIFYPWTFLTAGLVETTIIELFFTLLFVPASFRYLERLWGATETIKFIVISITIPNIMSCAISWLEYAVFRNPNLFLYGVEYYGQMALQTAILVAFTQIIPEHQIQMFGVVKIRVKRLPMAYVTLSTVLVLLGFQSPWINIQWGWLVSWWYLRFYKHNRGDTIVGESYGDRSETFAFVQWFPPFLHYPVSIVSRIVHSICTKLHLLPSSGTDVEAGGYTQVPGGPRAEAERRRALALKALDQRLANAAAPPPVATKPSSSSLHSGRDQALSPTSHGGPSSPAASTGTGTGKGRPHERQKSVSEMDLGESTKAGSPDSAP